MSGSPSSALPPLAGLLALLALPACAPEPEPPPAPEVVWLGDPVPAEVELLLDSPPSFAAPLPDWRILAQVDGALLELGPLDAVPVAHGVGVGLLSAAAPLRDSAVLLSGSQGLFTLHPWGLAPSPLADVYDADGSERLLSAPNESGVDLWIAGDDGLALWRDGGLFDVTAGDLPTRTARVAWGSPVQDHGALWVAADEAVYALVEQGGGFVTWEEPGAGAALDLAVDGVDDLWVSVADDHRPTGALAGDLQRRLPDGTWQWFRLPVPAGALATSTTGSVWIAEAAAEEFERRLFHQLLDTWIEVSVDGGPALAAGDRIVGADPGGRLLIQGPAGLRRLALERGLIVLGLEDGATLDEPVEITVAPMQATEASALSITLDGIEQTLATLDLGDAGTAWQLSIDPIDLGDGAHQLALTAEWSDGHEPVEQSVFFSVGAFVPPTWSEDVEPIHVEHCARCHTPNGGAHLLDTRERWRAEIDLVLQNIISGAMPLSGDKVDPDQLRTIELWRAGDFQE